MSLQLRFGLIGAGLGLVLGLIGGLSAVIPFGIIVLRSLVSAVIAGLLGFGLHAVIQKFLPELLGDTKGSDDSHSRVDITLPEETIGPNGDVQPYTDSFSDSSESDSAEGGLIEEVSEDARGGASASTASAFSEDAFFQGVERLPDIGGLSEQFSDADSTEEDEAPAPRAMSNDHVSQGSAKSNMDPALMAKAIRTALKKDEN